jgi:methyl-accepting chemotaxis protein
MQFFLNLSVGKKLMLSALLPAVLLAAQALRSEGSIGEVIQLTGEQNATLAASTSLQAALADAVRADALSITASTAQTGAISAQAAAAASEKLESVQRLLLQAAGQVGRPEAGRALEESVALAASYGAALGEAMAVRQRMLDLRDTRFFPNLTQYDQRFEGVLNNVAFEIEGTEAQERARDRLLAFTGAVNDMRMSVQRYLATEEPDQARRVTRAVAQQRAHGRGLTVIPMSAGLKTDLDKLLEAADGLAVASTELIATVEAIKRLRADKVVPARDAIETAMQRVSGLMSTGVRAGDASIRAHMAAMRDETLAVAALVGVLLLLCGWVTARAVGAPLRRLSPVLQRIAGGDTGMVVSDQRRGDEIGMIARALDDLRRTVADAFAQRQMIEQMPVGVMRANPADEFRIDFMNTEMRAILKNVPQILPCPPEEVLGQSVDIFHADPAHQRALLKDGSRLPYRARINVAGEVMDLSVSAIRDSNGAYLGPMLVWTMVTEQARLADTFEAEMGSAVGSVTSRTAELQLAARRLATAADTSGREAALVAEAAGRADADVQSVAAAAEQMAASIDEITRRVSESAQVAGRAVREAQATDATMRGLSESAARIGDVVKLIGDIAGQTNLLALNATIEAARAGESGKGFAVVASEVKNLAGQTARATEEIAGQIAEMQAATGRAVEAIRGIGGTVERTSEIATAIAAAVEQQGAATQEIARSAAQVAEATGTVTRRIGLVRKAAEDTGSAAGGMLGAVEELAGQASVLRDRSGAFLTAIRA